MLKTFREGQLVSVATDDGDRDGVVVHVASLIKIEVAVEQSGGDPVFRTVHPKLLMPRDEPGPGDDVLRRLIHRAATPGHGAAGGASGRGRRAHTRAAAHRATDR
jgi:hypothetical protein